MLGSRSPHVATAVFPHSLGCRLETIGHNTVTLWKCVGAVIGCGKISITNCGWKQNAILLAYITSGSDSGTFVFTACADMLYICSELSFPGACPQPHTLQGKRNILLNSWLMLIKLSRCICICSGICCRMFSTAHSLSCASNTCCCKTSRPRSDISSEALRSIAVMPCVPICQQPAAPH